MRQDVFSAPILVNNVSASFRLSVFHDYAVLDSHLDIVCHFSEIVKEHRKFSEFMEGVCVCV